jgi:outer membrane protein assembly factor BamA
MRFGPRSAILLFALMAHGPGAAVTAVHAQGTQAGPTNPVAQQPAEPQIDIFDVARRLFKDPPANPLPTGPEDQRKLHVTLVPGIGYNPSAGFVIGASANLSKYFGDAATTRLSTSVIGMSYSSRQQASFTVKVGMSGKDNRWRFDGDNRFQWTSQNSYGVGMAPTPADIVETKFTFVRIYDVALYKLGKNVYAGAGFHYSLHTDVRPAADGDPAWEDSAYVTYSQQNGFDVKGQSSAGASLNLTMDTRDNPVNASRGWVASLSYRPFIKDLLGGDSTWQQMYIDARSFVGLTKDRRQRLALWVYGDLGGRGTAPYFDLPSLGVGSYGRSGRGYTEGRYRGQQLVYGEVEYRATLTRNGLLGVAGFLNTTTVSNEETGERLFDGFAGAGGIGLRVKFSKRSRTNMCIDYAWGRQGARGFYLALQEAF